ncbi:unnamed protein product [Polarella glacialis]|uniref:Uncharacterized protein n=1 Tax=Polarella glacialis TaxID=89957 RepID=A0A813EWC5_POLGL|nr:unnamed protein product [Polarella glacialis]
MATSSEIYFELVELSGHVVAKGAWSADLRADCLYQSARLAKPGRRCRLLEGTWEILPTTPLAALDLGLGTCIQVVWLSSSAADRRWYSFAAIKANGSVVTWGKASEGGDSAAVAPLLTEGVVQVCGTAGAFAAIKANGSVVTWGNAQVGGDSAPVAPLLTEGVVQVCGTARAFAAIKANGSVVTWGNARFGGDSAAVAPLLTEGVVQVCGTAGAFAAIKANGSVVTWGYAEHGGSSSAVAPLLTEGVVHICGNARLLSRPSRRMAV